MSKRLKHRLGTACCTKRSTAHFNLYRSFPDVTLDDSQVTCIVCLREMLKKRVKVAAINILVEKQRRFGTVIFNKAKIEEMVNKAEASGNLWPKEKEVLT